MTPARVVLLAGPSGSGKSYVARRSGLPVLALDHFYRDGDDPGSGGSPVTCTKGVRLLAR